MDQIFNNLSKLESHNDMYLFRYIKFINHIINRHDTDSTCYYENHHICPKSLFPELEHDKDNIVRLSYREHFLAHWMLARAFKGKMSQAFFCMVMFTETEGRLTYSVPSNAYSESKRLFKEHCRSRVGAANSNYKSDIFKFKHKDSKDEFVGTRFDFSLYSGISPQEIYNIISERSKHSRGWGIFLESINMYSYEKPHGKRNEKKRKITCEHCGKTVMHINYKRWHGHNCKKIDPDGHIIRTRQVSNINLKNQSSV